MKIKVKKIGDNIQLPEQIKKGDWIDLATADETVLMNGQFTLIPLGVAMQLPAGYEAIVVPRSSTYKKYGVIQANSVGVIDNSYCGNNDQWHFPAIALMDTFIGKDVRICQFRIQLSQFATFWQKIKWLFTSKIEIEEVDILYGSNRGGFGSTGK